MAVNFFRSKDRSASGSATAFRDDATGFSGWRIALEQKHGVPTPAISGDRLFVGGGFGSYDF
jgi:hypothetical protein